MSRFATCSLHLGGSLTAYCEGLAQHLIRNVRRGNLSCARQTRGRDKDLGKRIWRIDCDTFDPYEEDRQSLALRYLPPAASGKRRRLHPSCQRNGCLRWIGRVDTVCASSAIMRVRVYEYAGSILRSSGHDTLQLCAGAQQLAHLKIPADIALAQSSDVYDSTDTTVNTSSAPSCDRHDFHGRSTLALHRLYALAFLGVRCPILPSARLHFAIRGDESQ